MKVAISIPDDVFADAEALVKRTKLSRSKLYANAIKSYVAASEPDSLTAMINAIIDQAGKDDEQAISRVGAATVLKHTEW